MNVLYEEAGELKVAAVLSQAPASLQVQSPHGRRTKVRLANVLLWFDRPAGADLLAEAQRFAEGLDADFLWQCCGGAEFGFEDLAREYVGRAPAPPEAAGVLLKLYSAPMYFYRRGCGRFQAAPEATLKAALAGLQKKKRVQEQIAAWSDALSGLVCPAEIAALKDELLYAPDRTKPETKAVEQACARTGLSAARLFERLGLLADTHAYHLNRFLYEFYPGGAAFPAHPAPVVAQDLPLAAGGAFSLDDVGTTEIDDAFSVTRASDDLLRVGIHIAAPALGIVPGSPLDAIARERLSTAYLPGRKFTMLPEDAVSAFSLDAGTLRPVVSLYLEVRAADLSVRARHTRLERMQIAANLRHPEIDRANDAFASGTRAGVAFEDELHLLWRLAESLERVRGRPGTSEGEIEYVFRIADGRVRIEPRRRGAPLDKLVAELMILANGTWGEFLAERDIAAIYRVQSSGKVRLSVHPEAHGGLGLSCYAWMTSPLRRYVDLVNQRQLTATLRGARAPLARNSEALHAALRAFEVSHARYEEHQRAMETYWSLRWLLQEKVRETAATVLRENVVRLEGLPLTTRVPSLPELDPGARVRVAVEAVDLIERTVRCAWRATLAGASGATATPGNGQAMA